MESHTLIVHSHTILSDDSTRFSRVIIGLIISIEAGLNVEQFQFTVRACRDGQRYLHFLAVGGGRTRVCRYHLVVDIHLTLDEPVVGRRCHINTLIVFINTVVGITVIDNTL